MSCTDPVCQQLMTCKWDMPISNTFCEATWYPKTEPEPVVISPEFKLIEEVTPPVSQEALVPYEKKFKPSTPSGYRQEFLGRSYREEGRTNNQERRS